MNRIIKFRAWDNVKKEWVKYTLGFAINFRGEIVCPTYTKTLSPVSKQFELMQFTGLLDKNGKEIFEGDIVVCREMHDSNVFDGVWGGRDENGVTKPIPQIIQISENPPFNFVLPSDIAIHPNWWEVIGNIYEKPELLNK